MCEKLSRCPTCSLLLFFESFYIVSILFCASALHEGFNALRELIFCCMLPLCSRFGLLPPFCCLLFLFFYWVGEFSSFSFLLLFRTYEASTRGWGLSWMSSSHLGHFGTFCCQINELGVPINDDPSFWFARRREGDDDDAPFKSLQTSNRDSLIINARKVASCPDSLAKVVWKTANLAVVSYKKIVS